MAHRPERTLSPENSDSMKYLSNPSVVKGLFTALLLLASSVARPQSANPDTPSYTMRSGGTERSYKLPLPQGLPQGAPLVVVLHGYGANNAPGRFGMNAAADRHGFAVCYPQGAKDGRGKTCWNVGYPFQADMAIDDVEFITQLVRHLQKKHGLSRRNVFCTDAPASTSGPARRPHRTTRPRLYKASRTSKTPLHTSKHVTVRRRQTQPLWCRKNFHRT